MYHGPSSPSQAPLDPFTSELKHSYTKQQLPLEGLHPAAVTVGFSEDTCEPEAAVRANPRGKRVKAKHYNRLCYPSQGLSLVLDIIVTEVITTTVCS